MLLLVPGYFSPAILELMGEAHRAGQGNKVLDRYRSDVYVQDTEFEQLVPVAILILISIAYLRD
jgi:hypothetical protein